MVRGGLVRGPQEERWTAIYKYEGGSNYDTTNRGGLDLQDQGISAGVSGKPAYQRNSGTPRSVSTDPLPPQRSALPHLFLEQLAHQPECRVLVAAVLNQNVGTSPSSATARHR
jgi:hypothetical protein